MPLLAHEEGNPICRGGACHRIERGLTTELNLYVLITIGLIRVKFNDACVMGGRLHSTTRRANRGATAVGAR